MTDKELRAYVEKAVQKMRLPNCPYLKRSSTQSRLVDITYALLLDFRAKAEAERRLYYLGRHIGDSFTAEPLD